VYHENLKTTIEFRFRKFVSASKEGVYTD